MTPNSSPRARAWRWVPSLYYAEGLPYVVVMIVSVIMYKRFGISNTEIALYTSWLYLPWVIKPLWSPLVELVRTKRIWIVAMQLLVGAGLAGVALSLPTNDFFRYSMAFLWLLAFSSATHDIAADGFYMLGLSDHDQAWFVGIRSTFYRMAMITGQGLLVILAGYLETATGLEPASVEIRVEQSASPQAFVHPDSVAWRAPRPESVAMPAMASGETSGGVGRTDSAGMARASVPVGLASIPAARADSLIAFARAWNERYGFVAPVESDAQADQEDPPGWWTLTVSRPLAAWLGARFGENGPEASPSTALVGPIALIPVMISPSPGGHDVVVNLSRESGDASIRLLAGERLVFGALGEGRPALAVIQVDARVRAATDAVIVARSGNIPLAWSITFFVLAGLFLLFSIYHQFALPRPEADVPSAAQTAGAVLRGFGETFASFFRKPGILAAVAFMLFYRFAEAQLVKLAAPFLLDAREAGGLALSTGEVGFVYGTVGIVSLTLGGVLGGFLAAKNGLKYWLWWMVIAINLPNAVYVFLAYATPESLWVINAAVAVEQFGYGFGFTAYMLVMIYIADGPQKTAHYAICTGFMALGMMIPGMFSGWLQDIVGYRHFFLWVMLATVPAFLVSGLVRVRPSFGRKDDPH